MSTQRRIAAWLVDTCLENGLFGSQPGRVDLDGIGDLDLREGAWFDSMSLVFLQAEIESEWGVHVPNAQFAAWLRTLNQIAHYVAERLPVAGPHSTSDRAGARSLS
jgi:acyl carrier protein